MSRANKVPLYYALFDREESIYEQYVTEQGDVIQVDTGETKIVYSAPVEFKGNIAESGGESQAVEFGVSVADYEAILVVSSKSLPITETSLIWQNTKPQYNADGTVDGNSADYTVIKPVVSKNVGKYVLKKVVK